MADARAGSTLFALEAMGLVYLNVVRLNRWRQIVLILIVPISPGQRRRVMIQPVTYHLGDEAGQGFPTACQIVLFVAAIFLMVGADTVVRGILGLWRRVH